MYLFQHSDFPLLIEQTATYFKMPFAFIEKDYWITYVLYRLKESGVDDFIFKGGTSLTKAWNLLDRFSEDVDLLFTPHNLTKDKKRTRLRQIKDYVSKFEGLTFSDKLSDSKGHYRTDCYRYEMKENSSILLPYIKLEMGYRGGDSPSCEVNIQSYIGQLIENRGGLNGILDLGKFKIKVLDYRRTFSEKIFAIYSAFTNNTVEKYFRHYYDIFKLLQLPDIINFIGSKEYKELKTHIAAMSKEFYNTKTPHNLDFSKSEAFVYSENLEEIITRALKNSADLFFVPAPTAKEILTVIERQHHKF